MTPSTYLLVLGERKAIYWVLSNSRTAFTKARANQVSALNSGDSLLLYTTRGAFHNPTGDRGRIIGEATVRGAVSQLDRPVVLAGREFSLGVTLDIPAVAPCRSGLDLSRLVPDLQMFPDKRAWAVRLRNSIVAVPPHDSARIRREMRAVATLPLSDVLAGYYDAARLSASE